MWIEEKTLQSENAWIPPLVAQIIWANGKRVSKTLAYVSMPEVNALRYALDLLKRENEALYEQVIEEWIVVDLWWGESIPLASNFEKHPLKAYVSIDLNHDDSTDTLWTTIVITKKWDFYSVLESLPDNSIPTIHLRMLDEIIIPDCKERVRLRDLIKRKLKLNGLVISVASRIFPWNTWIETVYLQPNLES
jgi:hypothetical protein